MEFGKLPSVENVDFTLPPDPEQNQVVLQGLGARTGPPVLYIGATGYNMKPWVGTWYPKGTKDREFLAAYGRQFNTIEHNTTHYRIPDESMVDRWREETPDDFRFCPKIPQVISHSGNLGLNNQLNQRFCEAIAGLENKLGCCFMQLPPHFSTKQLIVLEQYLERFPPGIPLSIEVRHPSFFEATVEAETFFQLLENYRVAAMITDVAGRRDVCHLRVTCAQTLIRFVGNGLHPSDYTRVQDWALRLKSWYAQGLKAAYLFTHEPDNLLAPDLAAYCADYFKSIMPDLIVRGPRAILPPALQGSLF